MTRHQKQAGRVASNLHGHASQEPSLPAKQVAQGIAAACAAALRRLVESLGLEADVQIYYDSTVQSKRKLHTIAQSLGIMQQAVDASALACGIDMEPVIEEVQAAFLHARPVDMRPVIDRQMRVVEHRVMRGWGFGENYFHWFERGVSLCGRARNGFVDPGPPISLDHDQICRHCKRRKQKEKP